MSARGGGRGRGANYRALYGGGGGGRGRGRGGQSHAQQDVPPRTPNGTRDWETLSRELNSIDGQQYGQYKRLVGQYEHSSPSFTLAIDHVQADAYAPPSRIRAILPLAVAGFPDELWKEKVRRIALADYVTRTAAAFIRNKHMDEAVSGEHGGGGGGWAGPKGGTFNINAPGQEVLERTSCVIRTATADDHLSRGTIELRFTVALPARGRTILGREAHRILAGNLPLLIKQSVLWMNQDQQALIQHIRTIEDQEGLRSQLKPNGLVAFVANGSILPRASGASSLPMTGNGVVPFQSPSDLELELVTPNGGSVRGMGIPRGITVLSGGGFHGKSTLLEALELGVYNHISGDGRESVVTDPTAVKIRAEDGRNVSGVDISPLISGLPGGKDTSHYSSEDASGSTSMAANIQEALSLGCTALLIDEDSSATNLLVRDQRMQALIQNETITPLVSKVRALYAQHGVSTIIVIGGCGDYLSVADLVLVLSSYTPTNLTARASQIVQVYPTSLTEHASYGALPGHRTPTLPASLLSNRPPAARGKSFISLPAPHYGPKDPSASEPGVDISGLVQLVEAGQANLAAHVIRWLARRQSEGEPEGNRPLGEVLGEVGRLLEAEGLDAVQAADEGRLGGDLVFTRALELGGVLGRIRGTS